METLTEYIEGMQFDCGYISSYFVPDINRMEAVYKNPYILIHAKFIRADGLIPRRLRRGC